jgi:hypothetical protein
MKYLRLFENFDDLIDIDHLLNYIRDSSNIDLKINVDSSNYLKIITISSDEYELSSNKWPNFKKFTINDVKEGVLRLINSLKQENYNISEIKCDLHRPYGRSWVKIELENNIFSIKTCDLVKRQDEDFNYLYYDMNSPIYALQIIFSYTDHLKSLRMFESTLTKNELVDKIKYLSHYLETYLRDVNKFTTSNLNFSFSYGGILDIKDIFIVANRLDYNSTNGFITAVAQEFIIWSEYFTEAKWHGNSFKKRLESFKFNDNYLNYTDEYKKDNRWELYKQEYNHMLYGYVGQTIKNLISGTIWDIPEKEEFTEEDRDFILECIYYEYEDLTSDYMTKASKMIDLSKEKSHTKGYILRIPVFGTMWDYKKIDYNIDFIKRLESHFGAVFILEGGWGEFYRLCLPFYK